MEESGKPGEIVAKRLQEGYRKWEPFFTSTKGDSCESRGLTLSSFVQSIIDINEKSGQLTMKCSKRPAMRKPASVTVEKSAMKTSQTRLEMEI